MRYAAVRCSAAVACAGALTLIGQAAAGAVTPRDPELFVLEERVITVEAPAPGEHSDWAFNVGNATGNEAEVFVRLSDAEGPLFAGADPGEVAIGVDSGSPVLAGPVQDLVGDAHVPLAVLPAAGELRVTGEISLPRAAGNEYQGASGKFTIEIASARQEVGPGGGSVAETGGTSPWVWGVAAAALTAGGILVARRARSQAEDQGRQS
ncbi:hypothetical protein [Leucobacter aridicollis]|uniref:hypothetical protein n=1 Tax=Leucobacter aridicollis TaxID=283878 RepID=UPI0021075B37|nr:hypothetical protein [Leucobacter aridicollis]UTX53807.1 hypothetical protein KI794_03485 [Leucobacter aridicollis]